VSVVFPTYNERDSIRVAILDFLASGVVDEVVVVNNNAAEGTSEEIAKAAAEVPDGVVREVHEPRQGYGFAIQRGMRETTGDYIVVSEPDGTFLGRDVPKLLAYADDFDVVYGSRTARMFIWRGANMGAFLRWGNWAVAKLMEFLFNATNLTDVGCTMRLIRREAAQRLAPFFTIGGNAFGPEMMVLSLLHGLRVIQVPVNYLPRVGASSVTGDPRKAVLLGLWMIGLVFRYRLRSWFGGLGRSKV
jgi:glycosyltransferase involved in cell wall biosynthesis